MQASTVSTASDQVRLAMRAMDVRALRLIVAMAQATLPVAGRQYNKDALLGQAGIVGIKTGTTSQAGGCFVFAAREHLAGRSITVVGAVLHQCEVAQPEADVLDKDLQVVLALAAVRPGDLARVAPIAGCVP